MAGAIDGDDGASWHLPLPPLTATSLEPYSPGNPSTTCIHFASLETMVQTAGHQSVPDTEICTSIV